MKRSRIAGFIFCLMGMALAGCGDVGGAGTAGGAGGAAASSSGGAMACVPGKVSACACIGGGQGVQTCRDDGSGYDACMGCGGSGGSSSGASSSSSGSMSSSSGAGGSPIPCPGGPGEIDLHVATLYDNPPGMVDWPVTTTLTEVDFNNDGVYLEFSKKDGPGRWPDIIPPGWDGPLEYTVGMAECINGQWYASAAIQYWYGLNSSGGNIALDNQVAKNWYYDARWGELAGRQPATGETIGIFVVAGNARGVHEDTVLQSPVMERSNVVLVPMPDVNGAMHSF